MVGLPQDQVESGRLCQCADLLCLGYSWCICDQNRKWALHVLVWHAPRSYKQNYHTGFAGVSGSGCYCHTDHPFWAQQESLKDGSLLTGILIPQQKKLGAKIDDVVNRRITKAYPQKQHTESEEAHPEIFAYGCSFYKIVLLFFIGAFLGDITETIFCRITAGYWMSRSSVVWGDFSIVWGTCHCSGYSPSL